MMTRGGKLVSASTSRGAAERTVVLVDGHVGPGTLNVLARKRPGGTATIWASRKGDGRGGGALAAILAYLCG